MENNYKMLDGKSLIRTIFTDYNNFQELVRASEGVIRDMINIFTIAFFDSLRQGQDKIDKNPW